MTATQNLTTEALTALRAAAIRNAISDLRCLSDVKVGGLIATLQELHDNPSDSAKAAVAHEADRLDQMRARNG